MINIQAKCSGVETNLQIGSHNHGNIHKHRRLPFASLSTSPVDAHFPCSVPFNPFNCVRICI